MDRRVKFDFGKEESQSYLVDLSHTVMSGLKTYKGLPAPVICDYLSHEGSRSLYDPGTEFQIARIEMVAYEGHPFLTRDAAEYLRDCGARLVGIDSHNIDDTTGGSRPVHTILLGAGILIVEHLCQLQLLPESRFVFSAIPPKFKGVGTFPVRAMARVAK